MLPNTNIQTPSSAEAQPFSLGTVPSTVGRTDSRLSADVKRPEVCDVWGTDFAVLDMTGTLELAKQVIECGVPEFFVTANLNYLMLCEQHPRLREINQHAAAVLADGQPIVTRSQYTASPLPCRVAGSDLILELGALSAREGYRIFLLGGAPGIADSAAERLLQLNPNLQIAGTHSPPFRSVSSAEHEEMLQQIRQTKPDILLVAFGQPKGEFWIYDNLSKLQVPLSIQLGASFDFLAGKVKRSPAVLQHLGCEWLHRAWSDPKRLIPRYAANALFLSKLFARDAVRLAHKS